MESEDWAEDEGNYPGVPLPSPDDRIWRHPSELAATGPIGGAVTPERGGRSLVGLTVVASVAASALFVTGLLAVTVGLGSSARERSPGVTLANTATTSPAVGLTGGPLDRGLATVAVVAEDGRRSGSAVAINAEGTLVTTAPLVRGAQTIDVTLHDGSHHAAVVAGVDPESGIAVLSVQSAATATMRWRPAVRLVPGDVVTVRDRLSGTAVASTAKVVVVGENVTTSTGETFRHAIRLEADRWSVAEGASVFDDDERLVAITVLGVDGTIYALPIEIARSVAASLESGGAVRPALLGVEGGSLTEAEAAQLGVEDIEGGAVIERLNANGPAANAGIRIGDVIVSVGGQPVRSVDCLVILIRSHQPGDEIGIEFVRDGKLLVTTATLGERALQPAP